MKKILALLLTLTFFTNTVPVWSANISLSQTPSLIRIIIKPGKTVTQNFSLTNLSDSDKVLNLRLVPFTIADELGNPNIDPRATSTWLDFLTLDSRSPQFDQPFTLKAGQSINLGLILNVPLTARLGDYYAAFLAASYANTLNRSFQGSNISATLGSNLLISISTKEDPPAILKVTDLLPQHGKYIKLGGLYFLDNITPLYFTALARNEGEFTATTKGVFKIARGDKTPLDMQSVLPQYVISKSTRLLGTLSDTKFRFSPRLKMIGKYSVNLDIRSENANTSTQIDIILFPAKALLGTLATALIVLLTLKVIGTRKTKSVS